jgi:hypothetical protein
MVARATRGLFLAAALLVWGMDPLAAQISSEGSDTHSIISSRAAALGDPYVSEDLEPTVMYWNPAALVRLRRESLFTNFALELDDANDQLLTENITLPLPAAKGWGFGVGLTITHVGKTTIDGPLDGLAMSIFKVDAAAAAALGNAMSLGGALTLSYGEGGGKRIPVLSGSFGIFYAPDRVFSYGFALHGVGDRIDFGVQDGQTVVSNVSMLKSIESGLTVRSTEKEYQRYQLSIAAQKVFTHSGLTYKGGLEVLPVQFLALRGGYWVGPHSQAARFGAGLIFGSFFIDYAFAPNRLEPRYHQVSLSYDLQPSHAAR